MHFDVSISINPTVRASEHSGTLKTPKQEEDLFKVALSVLDLMPHSYREQSKKLLTYLAEKEHVPINRK